jgi:hypothetical protein
MENEDILKNIAAAYRAMMEKKLEGSEKDEEEDDEEDEDESEESSEKGKKKKSKKKEKDDDEEDDEDEMEESVKYRIPANYAQIMANKKRKDLKKKMANSDAKSGVPNNQPHNQSVAEDTEELDEYTRKGASGQDVEDSGWHKSTVRRDKYGNVIKKQNIAKHLAKKGRGEAESKTSSDNKRKLDRVDMVGRSNTRNEEVEQIDELKKSTYARYIKKAVGAVRGTNALANDFDHDSYRPLKKMNRHSKNIMNYDKSGKLKKNDPEKYAKAKAEYETLKGLSDKFRLKSNNRVVGIRRAANALAKEGFDVFSEKELDFLMNMGIIDESRRGEHTKGATAPEGLLDKSSPKSKQFVKDHQKSDEDMETKVMQGHKDASKAGRATGQAPARNGSDNLSNGDPKTPGKV